MAVLPLSDVYKIRIFAISLFMLHLSDSGPVRVLAQFQSCAFLELYMHLRMTKRIRFIKESPVLFLREFRQPNNDYVLKLPGSCIPVYWPFCLDDNITREMNLETLLLPLMIAWQWIGVFWIYLIHREPRYL